MLRFLNNHWLLFTVAIFLLITLKRSIPLLFKDTQKAQWDSLKKSKEFWIWGSIIILLVHVVIFLILLPYLNFPEIQRKILQTINFFIRLKDHPLEFLILIVVVGSVFVFFGRGYSIYNHRLISQKRLEREKKETRADVIDEIIEKKKRKR